MLTFDGTHALTVTGILRDLPHNTQLAGDLFISLKSKANRNAPPGRTDWFDFKGYTYISLAPAADPSRVQAKMSALLGRHVPPDLLKATHSTADQIVHARMIPFRDVHLSSHAPSGMSANGSWTTVYGFAAIAALILAIAGFNFMNLATARAMIRAREVGLRKVLGAKRRQLVVQFLGESVLMALIALLFALAIVEILTPAYDRLLGAPIQFHYLAEGYLTLEIIAVATLTGLLGGLYPALILSGFRPGVVLRSNSSKVSGSGLLRTGLVVLQFAISIGLGIAAMVIFSQVTHARNIDLGFDRDNVVIVGSDGRRAMTLATAESFADALSADPDIVGVARSGSVPFEHSDSRSGVQLPGHSQQIIVRTIVISPNLSALYGMHLLAGRFLSRAHGGDVSRESASGGEGGGNVIIDATAARRFGFTPGTAIGKTLRMGAQAPVTIVGVVSDALFHVQSLPIGTVYVDDPAQLGSFSVRIKHGHVREALAAIDATWHRFAPTVAIQRYFLDDSFDKLFAADERQGHMFAIFVGIAVFIACLGLYGLAAFTAQRRTREIGIRKVFGARTRDIVRLLLWQFSIPVLIANAIAWPVAWYYLHGWLQGFASRIWLSPAYFFAAGLVALVIAWATVAVHAIRVARANPVRALRYE